MEKSCSSSMLIMIFLVPFFYYPENYILSTLHLDGAFQNASSVLRILNGQMPGSDFYVYLGIMNPVINATISFLLGGSLGDIVASSYIFVSLSFFLKLFFLAYFVASKKKHIPLIVCSSFFLIAIISPQIFEFMMEPGNSLRPIRSFWICLSVFISFYIYTKPTLSFSKLVVLNTALITSLLLNSPDVMVTGLVMSFFIQLMMPIPFTQKIIVAISSLALSILIILTLFGMDIIEQYKYLFVDVRQDQNWYFGPYTVNFSIIDYLKFFIARFIIELLLLMILIIFSFYKRGYWSIFCFLLVGSHILILLISELNGHIGYNFYLVTIAILISAVLFTGFIIDSFEKLLLFQQRLKLNMAIFKPTVVWSGIPAAVMLVAVIVTQVQKYKFIDNKLYDEDNQLYYEGQVAPFLEFVNSSDDNFFEEYFGIAGLLKGANPEIKVDSIIHALGRERSQLRDYLVQKKPGHIFVTNPEFNGYFYWNLSANWWFFEIIYSEYSILKNFPNINIFKKTGEYKTISFTKDCHVENDKILLPEINKQEVWLMDITYDKSSFTPNRYLMIENRINFQDDAKGLISVNPEGSHIRLPVLLDEKVPYLSMFDASGFDDVVKACRLALLEHKPGIIDIHKILNYLSLHK